LLLSLDDISYNLSSFRINDVHLDASPTPVLDDHGYVPCFELATIGFINMQNAICAQGLICVLRSPEPDNVEIIGCPPLFSPHGPGYGPLVECALSLKGIGKSEDLTAHLEMFLPVAEDLVIDDCPSFNDDILSAMMKSGCDTGMLRCCAEYLQRFGLGSISRYQICCILLIQCSTG
jgi:hypothetical protein